eukprot:1806419-Pleurochrysis_carterae.AAC.1
MLTLSVASEQTAPNAPTGRVASHLLPFNRPLALALALAFAFALALAFLALAFLALALGSAAHQAELQLKRARRLHSAAAAEANSNKATRPIARGSMRRKNASEFALSQACVRAAS